MGFVYIVYVLCVISIYYRSGPAHVHVLSGRGHVQMGRKTGISASYYSYVQFFSRPWRTCSHPIWTNFVIFKAKSSHVSSKSCPQRKRPAGRKRFLLFFRLTFCTPARAIVSVLEQSIIYFILYSILFYSSFYFLFIIFICYFYPFVHSFVIIFNYLFY